MNRLMDFHDLRTLIFLPEKFFFMNREKENNLTLIRIVFFFILNLSFNQWTYIRSRHMRIVFSPFLLNIYNNKYDKNNTIFFFE